jgi:hypothetical protein
MVVLMVTVSETGSPQLLFGQAAVERDQARTLLPRWAIAANLLQVLGCAIERRAASLAACTAIVRRLPATVMATVGMRFVQGDDGFPRRADWLKVLTD